MVEGRSLWCPIQSSWEGVMVETCGKELEVSLTAPIAEVLNSFHLTC